jgi:hypothetical protein
MKNDIIDWVKFEPELDRFCKYSIMEGLKFVARRINVFDDDIASRLQQIIMWVPVFFGQFKACDYLSNHLDDLIRIMIKLEPDQERKFQDSKTYCYI